MIFRHGGSQQTATGPGGRRAFGGTVTLTEATARSGDIGVYLNAIGTVTPVYTATLSSQVTGVVVGVHFRQGQMVYKGEPLVDIDPRQYEANVEVASGNLKRDQNLLAQAKMDLARYQAAWAKNAIARQTLDDQEKVVLQDEGLVEADQGTLAFDKVQLSYCHITAPFAGKVGLRLVDPGNLVQAGSSTPLAVVTQMDPITVVFTLAENNLQEVLKQMRAGHTLTVEAWDRNMDTKLATGRLTAINNQIDTTTGTVQLRAMFNNPQDALFPNQFVNTRLLVETLHNQILIPTQAIQHNGNEAFVYVIKNGTAKLQDVTEGVSNEGVTAVQGIEPGEEVATSSYQKLVNGSKVSVVKSVPGQSNESSAP